MYNRKSSQPKGSTVADPSTNHEVNSAMLKIGAVWAGTIFGIKLSDLVLIATLIYTVLQIGLLISDRIVKPWLAERKSKILRLDDQINAQQREQDK